MGRMRFVRGLLPVALCFAALGPTLTPGEASLWEPSEDQSVLLNQQASSPARKDLALDHGPTLGKWRRRVSPRMCNKRPSRRGRCEAYGSA